MKIDVQIKEGVLVIYPKEKQLDSSVSMQFREKVKNYINEGHTQIVINLNFVDFIDSSGLGALVLGHKEVRKNGEMIVVSSNPNINNMLKLVRLDQVLNIYESEEDALMHLVKEPSYQR